MAFSIDITFSQKQIENSAREESCLTNKTFTALNIIYFTLLIYKIHGTDQDPLCKPQQLNFIFVIGFNTRGMDFTKDFI